MRSNFDLHAFPEPNFDVDIASRKGFCIYRFYGGLKLARRFHFGVKKSDKLQKIENFEFWSFGGLNLVFRLFFRVYYNSKVTRRAGCSIPTRRVIRMQGNIHFFGSATNLEF